MNLEGFNSDNWLPFSVGGYKIDDANRLLQYLVENIFLPVEQKSKPVYSERVRIIYGGMTPSEYMRFYYETNKL